MSTKTNASAKSVKNSTSKNSPSKSGKNKATLAKVNLEASAKAAAKNRETIYIYPADCTTPLLRKQFRRKARQTKSSFNKQLAKLKTSNDAKDKQLVKELQNKMAAFSKATFA